MNSDGVLKTILRVIGGSSLLGLIFVAVPDAWRDRIHQALGLGPFSDQPVVGYLARSTSYL